MTPVAVMVHVPDVRAGLAWYRLAFPSTRVRSEGDELAILDVDGFGLEIVRADGKVAAGKGGSVLYWLVPDLEESLAILVGIGATLYRGPMRIEDGTSMCQVEDPFRNLIGLRGRTGGA